METAQRMVEHDVGVLTERSRVEMENMLEENINALEACRELMAEREQVGKHTRLCLRAQRMILSQPHQFIQWLRYRRAFRQWRGR